MYSLYFYCFFSWCLMLTFILQIFVVEVPSAPHDFGAGAVSSFLMPFVPTRDLHACNTNRTALFFCYFCN